MKKICIFLVIAIMLGFSTIGGFAYDDSEPQSSSTDLPIDEIKNALSQRFALENVAFVGYAGDYPLFLAYNNEKFDRPNVNDVFSYKVTRYYDGSIFVYNEARFFDGEYLASYEEAILSKIVSLEQICAGYNHKDFSHIWEIEAPEFLEKDEEIIDGKIIINEIRATELFRNYMKDKGLTYDMTYAKQIYNVGNCAFVFGSMPTGWDVEYSVNFQGYKITLYFDHYWLLVYDGNEICDYKTAVEKGIVTMDEIYEGYHDDLADIFTIEKIEPETPTEAPTEASTEAPVNFTVKAAAKVAVSKTTTVKVTGATGATFKSSDTKIATVSSKGVVKGVKAGTVTIKATVKGVTKSVKITVYQLANTAKFKAVKKTVKVAALKKKAVTVSGAIKVTAPKGKVTYTKKSGSKALTVNAKTGKITVKKGTKKGTYKVKVTVKVAGNTSYKAASKVITATIVVK